MAHARNKEEWISQDSSIAIVLNIKVPLLQLHVLSQEKKTSVFHVQTSCLPQCLDWKNFKGVSNVDDKNEDKIAKSVCDPKEESGKWTRTTEKAQHEMASWASVIMRYRTKHIWFQILFFSQTLWISAEIFFSGGRHLCGRVKITLGECILRVTVKT